MTIPRAVLRISWIAAGCLAASVSWTIVSAATPDLQQVRDLIKAGRLDEAEAAARSTLVECERTFGPNSLETAQTLDVLADSIMRQTKSEKPDLREIATRAVTIKRSLSQIDPMEIAISLGKVAIIDYQSQYLAEARDLYRQCTSALDGYDGPRLTDGARTFCNFGLLLRSAGQYAEAKDAFDRSIAWIERQGATDQGLYSIILNNLAMLLDDLGQYTEARSLFDRSIGIKEKVFGPESHTMAFPLNNLAKLNAEMGDLEEAKRLYERALAIHSRDDGEESTLAGSVLHNLATVYQSDGDLDRATSYADRARKIWEKAGSREPNLALILNTSGSLALEAGRLDEARGYFERALAVFAESAPDHPDRAETLEGLGRVEDAAGRGDLATSWIGQAIRVRTDSLGVDHPAVARARRYFASALYRTGDTAGALEAALSAETASREHLVLTIRSLEERRALRYAVARTSGMNLALIIAAEPGATSEAVRRVFDAGLRSRALVLDEMISRRGASRDPESRPLWLDLQGAVTTLANLYERSLESVDREQHREILERARRATDECERRLAEKSARFRRQEERSRIGLAEVAASLPPDAALVSYFTYDRLQPTVPSKDGTVGKPVRSYLAFVLRAGSDEPVVVPLGSQSDIDEAVTRWREEAGGAGRVKVRSPQQADSAYREVGGRLRAKIWDPLVPHLSGAQRVFVAPEGMLHLVSFASLPVGNDAFLLQEGPLIHYVSSERDLVRIGADSGRARGLLALGDPAYDAEPRSAVTATKHKTVEGKGAMAVVAGSPQPDTAITRGLRSACGDRGLEPFSPLRETQREVKEVTRAWRDRRTTSLEAQEPASSLLGKDADESSFKAQAPGKRVLHLATHGFFLGDRCPSLLAPSGGGPGNVANAGHDSHADAGENPLLLSGLALAGANRRENAGPGDEDGVLTAAEVASLDLEGTEWAVLSACSTGLGSLGTGEGVFGLRRAFQVAGARTVILSLWDVDDAATRAWMRALYESRFGSGRSTAEAVRDASLRVLAARRARKQSTHPFYWAAFVAAGDWR
ncbi:MAG: CHAT domain-containing protein [Acidobacteriia bacterium]|nr:CHAT domain-containing protein [Terriglobia bacterium]